MQISMKKFSELKLDNFIIGIVEKEQETRSDIGVWVCATLYSGCILECRDKPTAHCELIHTLTVTI